MKTIFNFFSQIFAIFQKFVKNSNDLQQSLYIEDLFAKASLTPYHTHFYRKVFFDLFEQELLNHFRC